MRQRAKKSLNTAAVEEKLSLASPRPAPSDTHNARGYTRREWIAAGYDPDQFDTAVPANVAPAEAPIADLLTRLRSPEGDVWLARIKAHPLAPQPQRPNGPTRHQLAHALEYAKESTWFAAADAVARELATEGGEAHEHDLRGLRSESVPVQPDGPPDTVTAGSACGDSTLRPAAEAITHVAEQVSGDGTDPSQPALFPLQKPFNLQGALDAIAEKNRAVKWAHERYESAKDDAAHRRKVWEREAQQLQDLIDDLDAKQKQRAREIAEAAETAAESAPGGAADAIDGEAGGDPRTVEIVNPEPIGAADATL